MDLSKRLYTSILTFFLTLFYVALMCYFVPRLILASDYDLFGLEMNAFLFIGLVPVILGLVILIGFIWGFIVAGTGTPVLYDMPEEMIVRGSYRFVRNPMYVGGLLLLLRQAILFKSFGFLLYLVVLFLLFNLLVVLVEERMLNREFGESYEQYCRSVPRWIPRLRPFRGDISRSRSPVA
jgi:protein-S-isoprenylcysteine O-methyltransferase Ste14